MPAQKLRLFVYLTTFLAYVGIVSLASLSVMVLFHVFLAAFGLACAAEAISRRLSHARQSIKRRGGGSLQTSEEIPFEERFGLMFVRVAVNDRELKFLFDTGATMSCVEASLGEELNLERVGEDDFITFTEKIRVPIFRANYLDVCCWRIENLHLAGSPSIKEQGGNGILGMNALRHFIVHVDYGRGVIRLERP